MSNEWPNDFLSPSKALSLWDGVYEYYVDKTLGDDDNKGLAVGAGHAFKTIGKFRDILEAGKLMPNNSMGGTPIKLHIADGDYSGEGTIKFPLMPANYLELMGNSGAPANVILPAIVFTGYGITLEYLTLKPTNNYALKADITHNAGVYGVICTEADAVYSGLRIDSGLGIINGCTISNRADAIVGSYGARIFSVNCGGTGNTVGLHADAMTHIRKSGTQPAGTTAEVMSDGGLID